VNKTYHIIIMSYLCSLLRLFFAEKEYIDTSYEEYLATLTSYGLDRLLKEPEIIRQDTHKIRQGMEELAFQNYKAFIQTSECVQGIHKEVIIE
jgi:hypothetical protein